jgi:hypothetical protein
MVTRQLLAIASAMALALFAAACGGGGDAGPTATPTVTSTPTPAGFLAIPTATPLPTDLPGTRLGPAGKCPPLPQAACAMPGEAGNVYQVVSMDRAVRLRARLYGGVERWVLDQSQVQEILRTLDHDITLQPLDISGGSSEDGQRFEFSVFWPQGQEPFPELRLNPVFFSVDLSRGVMGESQVQVQWPLPAEFGELLSRYLSDTGPTPPPPTATPRPTPTIVPSGAVFFDHPEGDLAWDGPDDRVRSMIEAHCGNYDVTQAFGVPGHIGVGREAGFWLNASIRASQGWHWTGYEHRDWRIMQGGDPFVIYLVNTREPRIAFVYQSFPCH